MPLIPNAIDVLIERAAPIAAFTQRLPHNTCEGITRATGAIVRLTITKEPK